jgi:hypothetical protein
VVRVWLEARIPRSEIERLLDKTDERLLVLYARMNGHEQRPDLECQIERLSAWTKTERAGREVLVSPIVVPASAAGRQRLRASALVDVRGLRR